jgi:phenylacetate-CoA ligase
MTLLQTIRFSIRAFDLGKVRSWEPERLEWLRDKRLRHMLHRAAAAAPFFRRKFHGLDLDRVELRELPPTTKEEMVAHFDETMTDPAVRRVDAERFVADLNNLGRYFLGKYAVSHTSGSQGLPLLILQDRPALEILFATMVARGSSFSKPGPLEGLRRLLRPSRLAIVTMERGFYPSGAAFEFMPDLVRAYVRARRFSSLDPNLYEQLNDFRPNVLVAYASVLECLALQANRLRLAPDLRQMTNTSERLTPRARLRVEQAFGVPVMDHYGAGECLFLSDGCPAGSGMHINADWVIVEVLDEDYCLVPPGQPGRKILITNLANGIQPFIRYELGDVLTMADRPCGCGSRLPLIARVDGRTEDALWAWDGHEDRPISSNVFQYVVDHIREAREWQAVQRERNRIELSLEMLPGATLAPEAARQAVAVGLQEFGLPPQVHVDVNVVPALLPDARTGKFRRVIPLPGYPARLYAKAGPANSC